MLGAKGSRGGLGGLIYLTPNVSLLEKRCSPKPTELNGAESIFALCWVPVPLSMSMIAKPAFS